MRLVVGIALVVRRIIEPQSAPPISLAVIHVLAIAAGILLLAGLWTPIAGVLLAIIEIWSAFTHPHDPWSYILLATLGAALAMLGPGAWSVDARPFWMEAHRPSRPERVRFLTSLVLVLTHLKGYSSWSYMARTATPYGVVRRRDSF